MDKILVGALEFAEAMDVRLRRDTQGRVTNRSTAYALIKRLPSQLKVPVGKGRFKIHLPKARKWLDDGGSLASSEESEASNKAA